MARVYARIPEELFRKAKIRARERGLVKPSGKENISGYLRQLVREDTKRAKMRRVSKDSFDRAADYLELDYIPEWIAVEEWREQDRQVQSLLIQWSDGSQVHSIEANRNLDEPIQCWNY